MPLLMRHRQTFCYLKSIALYMIASNWRGIDVTPDYLSTTVPTEGLATNYILLDLSSRLDNPYPTERIVHHNWFSKYFALELISPHFLDRKKSVIFLSFRIIICCRPLLPFDCRIWSHFPDLLRFILVKHCENPPSCWRTRC